MKAKRQKVSVYDWHFVSAKTLPRWVQRRFSLTKYEVTNTIHSGLIDGDAPIKYAKGRFYEYKQVGVLGDNTHWDAYLRRKRNRKHHHAYTTIQKKYLPHLATLIRNIKHNTTSLLTRLLPFILLGALIIAGIVFIGQYVDKRTPEEFKSEYISNFNQYRQSNGLHELQFTSRLNDIAVIRAKEISQPGNFNHNGITEYNLGENIAQMAYSTDSPKTLLSLWDGSPRHKANMLNSGYRTSGFAVNGKYAVQVFDY